MHVLIITFQLAGLDDAAYRQYAAEVAPGFSQVPGLISKTWLADPSSNTYGGVYLFRDRASLGAYLDSEIVRSLRTNPRLADVTTRSFGTVEPATAVTGGPLAGELAAIADWENLGGWKWRLPRRA